MKVLIKDFLGSELCITSGDGQKIFNLIVSCFKKNEKIELDFIGVRSVSPCFCNFSFNKLFENYTREQINRNVTLSNLKGSHQQTINRCLDNFEKYYNDANYRYAVDFVSNKMMESDIYSDYNVLSYKDGVEHVQQTLISVIERIYKKFKDKNINSKSMIDSLERDTQVRSILENIVNQMGLDGICGKNFELIGPDPTMIKPFQESTKEELKNEK